MDTIICPKCGTENPPNNANCQHCRIDLGFALAYPEQIGNANPEFIGKISSSGTASNINKVIVIIVISILAFVIGLFSIAVFIGVGEATNNAIYAFVAVSFPIALLAGFLSWLYPDAQWAVAIIMPAPVAILCFIGASMGGIYLPGGIWTVACAIFGANIGARLRLSRSIAQIIPPH